MSGFEFANTFNTDEEKVSALILDTIKAAYEMMGVDFDSLSDEQKMEIINKTMDKE